MNLNEPMIAELRIEAASTRKMLERLPPDALAWKPHPKSRSLGEIAVHVAALPGLFLGHLDQDELDRQVDSSMPRDAGEVLATFDAGVARALEVLAGLTDERFLGTWRYKIRGRLVFELPRLVVARTTALNHLIHHRGQLSVYLRMLDVPLPPVYGPTADEAM